MDGILERWASRVRQAAEAGHALRPRGGGTKDFYGNPCTADPFDTTEYARWKTFRDSEDSRYVGLVAPRMLMREPYGKDTVPVEAFNYEERVDGTDHNKYLWGNERGR